MLLIMFVLLSLQGSDIKVSVPTTQTTITVAKPVAHQELKVAPIANPLILVKE